jgi:hypothetical protein
MGEKRNAYRILVGSQKERHNWEDQDVGRWTILGWMVWIGLIWLRIGIRY